MLSKLLSNFAGRFGLLLIGGVMLAEAAQKKRRRFHDAVQIRLTKRRA